MKINKPFELVRMKVFDKNGNSIGSVDKVCIAGTKAGQVVSSD